MSNALPAFARTCILYNKIENPVCLLNSARSWGAQGCKDQVRSPVLNRHISAWNASFEGLKKFTTLEIGLLVLGTEFLSEVENQSNERKRKCVQRPFPQNLWALFEKLPFCQCWIVIFQLYDKWQVYRLTETRLHIEFFPWKTKSDLSEKSGWRQWPLYRTLLSV